MKIAIVSSTFLPAQEGVSITLWERLQQLSQDGHSVLCFVSSYREIGDLYPQWSNYVGQILKNVEAIALDSQEWMGIKRERNPQRHTLAIIDRALAKFQPDIIQIEEPERLWTTMFALPGLSYARRAGIPCIASYRTNFVDYLPDYTPRWATGISQLLARQLTRWIYNQYSTTLVGSKFIAQKLTAWGIKNVEYAPVIGTKSVASPQKLRQSNYFSDRYGLSTVDSTVKILFLGRLSPDKNWHFNCQYLPRLERLDSYTIIVAGTGELAVQLQNELDTKIPLVMLGEIPCDRVLELLANVDLHVTSSLKETFGRTVQESLAVGTPVLAPSCPWTKNLIVNNFNGILYQAQNGEDFVKKLTELIQQPDLRKNLQANALNNIEKQEPAKKWIEYLQTKIKHGLLKN
ncbi:MAG: glycosyltransferase [Cyanobacteria bacterium P01_G01_bin.19]